MHRTRTLHSLRTQSNADSVEFMPAHAVASAEAAAVGSDSLLSRTFVCGNYQLNEETRQKIGRIYLFQLQQAAAKEQKESNAADAADAAASAPSTAALSSSSAASAADSAQVDYALVEQQVLDTAAIFDLKWSPHLVSGQQLLGQVDASGALLLYEHRAAANAEHKSALHLTHTTQVVESASCLSLDWSNKRAAQDAPTIAISQSNASLSLWTLTPSGVQKLSSWVAHEYEVWIAHLSATDPSLLYSGADDCKFKGWDTRQSNLHLRSALFVDSSHEMGVCSIASHPARDHIVATGSYDETLRIWDVRRMDRPVLCAEHALGGGVWRVRWNNAPARQDQILACAMHNGFAVVSVDFVTGEIAGTNGTTTTAAAEVDSASNQLAASWLSEAAAASSSSAAAAPSPAVAVDAPAVSARTVAVYKAHSSLAYGADWISKPCAAASASASSASASPGLENDLIATCSFYDKQLDVWTISAEKEDGASSNATAAATAPAATGASS